MAVMAWISPLTKAGAPEGSRSLAAAHAATGGRMTNMKWTLAHSPAALEGTTTQEIAERSAGNLLPVPWIEPRDVAEAVLYLAGEGARYVTGTTLVIDAGLLTR